MKKREEQEREERIKEEQTRIFREEWVRTKKPFIKNCQPVPHPGIINNPLPLDKLFVHENGIVKYLYHDKRYMFFTILENEEKAYEKRKRCGDKDRLRSLCLN